MSVFDLALLLVLAVGLPILGRIETRRLEQAVAAGRGGVRVAFYRGTVLLQWVLVAALAFDWWRRDRSAVEIGLTVEAGWRFWLALAIALAGSVALYLQLLAARRPENRESIAEQFESNDYMMPHDRRELGWWSALSLTAGVCEQILYRGFMSWLFEPYLGFWGAAAGAVLLFGLGHVYQGLLGALKTAAFGAVAMALYLIGGSLLPPMILHVVMDLVVGRMGMAVRKKS